MNKLFISDCHISSGLGLNSKPYPWEWLTQKDHDRLLAFLIWLATRTQIQSKLPIIDEIIYLGDMFDGWVFPHDQKPPTFEEFLRSDYAAPLIAAMKNLSEKIPSVYQLGNHDLGMTSPILNSILPKVLFSTAPFVWDNIRAEHSNLYDLFNAPDPLRQDSLPMGYFLSRVAATMNRKNGTLSPGIEEEIKEIAQVIEDKETLPQGVFDAICDKASIGQNEIVIMPDDIWNGKNTTINEIRTMYQNLISEWRNREGVISADLAIAAACNDYSLIADELFLEGKATTVIFGHTHISKFIHHWFPFFRNRRYLNTGCFCTAIPKVTWVEMTEKKARLYSCAGFDTNRQPQNLSYDSFGSWSLW